MRNSFSNVLPHTAPATGLAPRSDARVFVAGIVMGEHQAP